MKLQKHRALRGGMASLALAGALAFAGAGSAFAATSSPFASDDPTGATTPAANLLKTYGVRAGSAGPDYLGISNTNFDFTAGSASSSTQYTGYTSASQKQLAGLAIWGTDVNENANPYYRNLLYNAITTGDSVSNAATTWMSNPSASSWGDSNGQTSATGSGIAGTEYQPQIIFGANKTTSWNLESDGSNSGTVFYSNGYTGTNSAGDAITYVTNDATNIYTQIYTMANLAQVAENTYSNKTTRYDAEQSAIDYEKATKGQMLYIASQIEQNNATKKTVAYLYAIDASGNAYFFVPTAADLSAAGTVNGGTTADSPNTSVSANNSTINMGYMAMLPFVTNTFDGKTSSGTYETGVSANNITMKVEDIYSSNPAIKVTPSAGSSLLSGVDVIIYNSTVSTSLSGTSGGKNSSGVNNDYNGDALSSTEVSAWAAAHGFSGKVIAGDDYGTSTNQTGSDTAPMLYCQRNYTADKNARAAWAFSQVYPELYKVNGVEYEDATYCYWVDTVYHVNTGDVAEVAAYMLSNGGSTEGVNYSSAVATMVANNAEAGYAWYQTLSSRSVYKSTYDFYNGSSRASYYGGGTAAEESSDTIGIFAPSSLWVSAHSS